MKVGGAGEFIDMLRKDERVVKSHSKIANARREVIRLYNYSIRSGILSQWSALRTGVM